MTNPALETLFYPLKSGAMARENLGQRIVFFNAQMHPALYDLKPVCLQNFKPYADALVQQDIDFVKDLDGQAPFDAALIVLPKNQTEAMGLIAKALESLSAKGVLLVSADNKTGGARLPKTLKSFGLDRLYNESKNKCRAVWLNLSENSPDKKAIQTVLEDAKPKEILDGAFTSVPGLYGWDKLDKGSAILAEFLPKDIKGKVADFGCGYGFLSRHVAKLEKVKSLACIDADWRALEMCRLNMAGVEGVEFHWDDLSQKSYKNAFDCIVMNPPFHEGKNTDVSLGQSFIQNAAASLKSRGILYMVANAHLPYELILERAFFKVEKICEERGFKVFRAQV